MLITTTEQIAGRDVAETLGVVQGSIIRSRSVVTDVGAGLKSIVGGEIRGYSQLIQDARKEALERMTAEATELDADAVVGLRFTTSTVMQGASEILAFGTAVKLR
ncbi:MAG: heavy metal-binding domain-containing protein [Candidatus Doudnabacteria bacterium]|nr:heavy metal-binding domain-containing protein [Candidatus Doudnabacteria bacterium]MCA9387606.1 heavy metal-binding domain-containing protein [Candidatus Andersenbacteria bacterium]